MKRNMEECLSLTPEEIDVEISDRRNLMQQMVGQLYPSILAAEIAQLVDIRDMPVLDRLCLISGSK